MIGWRRSLPVAIKRAGEEESFKSIVKNNQKTNETLPKTNFSELIRRKSLRTKTDIESYCLCPLKRFFKK